jgi:hypothetical protein
VTAAAASGAELLFVGDPAGTLTIERRGYTGPVCPDCDRIAWCRRGGHEHTCRYWAPTPPRRPSPAAAPASHTGRTS